ncbi:MAG: hypothetical protein K0S08_1570 [Gammaproteobacteria bacterium]|jgi:hypothetical protein|nr:hypothetical protein [Gammaproteobacteria bacterium]
MKIIPLLFASLLTSTAFAASEPNAFLDSYKVKCPLPSEIELTLGHLSASSEETRTSSEGQVEKSWVIFLNATETKVDGIAFSGLPAQAVSSNGKTTVECGYKYQDGKIFIMKAGVNALMTNVEKQTQDEVIFKAASGAHPTA